MGNAAAKEGENGHGEPTHRSDPITGNASGPVGSVDRMGCSPPESPRISPSPLMFAPQDLACPPKEGQGHASNGHITLFCVQLFKQSRRRLTEQPMLQIPAAPLQKATDGPQVFNQTWMNHSDETLDDSLENGIPMLITWSHGGNEVLVEGSWDNWTSRKLLQKTGKDYSILLVLPSGIYHYTFIVDGQFRYRPDFPHMASETGRTVNILDVSDYVPEILEGVSEFEAPPSPNSSYGRSFPVDEDFAKEPPSLPSQLQLTVVGSQEEEDSSAKPQHVVLNHLFIEKGWAAQSLVALGLTHRFQSKYVTVVLYKPMAR